MICGGVESTSAKEWPKGAGKQGSRQAPSNFKQSQHSVYKHYEEAQLQLVV